MHWLHAAGIIFDLNEVTDIVESSMLSHEPDYISVYSNSWGPSDNGCVVGGPGTYTAAVLEQAAAEVSHSTASRSSCSLAACLSSLQGPRWSG